MSQYIIIITIVGIAAFGMAWMPAFTKKTGISYSIIYVLFGVLLFMLFGEHLPSAMPTDHDVATIRLTEMVVIISLMGTGIKLDRPFSFKNWSSPLKLVLIAMLICIFAAAMAGYHMFGFDLASAVLLGAILAPTDPVLAADVQVGPPKSKQKFETKFALTSEAGLNDGLAFPFTWLAITISLIYAGKDASLVNWFAYDLLYKIGAGLLAGYLLGKLAGYMVFKLAKKYDFLQTRDGFLAIALTLMVYGLTELIHGYGFIAVFISAATLRHFEKDNDYHQELHSFTDQMERLLVAVVLILFGGALYEGILDPLTWSMVGFVVLFLFVIRPVAAYISLAGSDIHRNEKLAISFFGIRGIGSVFYLAFALGETGFKFEDELWALVALTILFSIIIHGLSATSVMDYLKSHIKREKIPD